MTGRLLLLIKVKICLSVLFSFVLLEWCPEAVSCAR